MHCVEGKIVGYDAPGELELHLLVKYLKLRAFAGDQRNIVGSLAYERVGILSYISGHSHAKNAEGAGLPKALAC